MKYIGKVRRSLLVNSWNDHARAMAGKMSKFDFKYLTQQQYDMLLDNGIIKPENLVELNESDNKIIAEIEAKQKAASKARYEKSKKMLAAAKKAEESTKSAKTKEASKPVVITYKDEDGENKIEFDNMKKAQEWVEQMEAKKPSGEKFELIDVSEKE